MRAPSEVSVAEIPVSEIAWPGAVRIIRSLYPPIDLFEDIADPADWPLLLSAEQKTNPRLMESVGNLALVPAGRRVSGPGSSWRMAPFTHASPDRPSRFSAGRFGVLYAGESFETALFETVHHHARFMAATAETPGWTSQFREILLDVRAPLHDLRGGSRSFAPVLAAGDYASSQALGARLHASHSEGVVYPSIRRPSGQCVGLFHPDLASNAVRGRHLDYHWNGTRVDLYRDLSRSEVYRIL